MRKNFFREKGQNENKPEVLKISQDAEAIQNPSDSYQKRTMNGFWCRRQCIAEFVSASQKLFIAGTFDGLHIGHQWMLWGHIPHYREAVIIIARDSTVARIKGRPPRRGEQERLQRLRHEQLPRTTVYLGRDDADFTATLREHAPDALLLGYDQHLPVSITQAFPHITILRAQPYAPEYFKSSRF